MLKLFRMFSVLSLALAAPELALAHAVLVASTPKMNDVVHGGKLHIDLKFNSRVDGPHCTIALVSPGGKVRPLALGAQTAPEEVASEVQDLAPGSYSLRWQALASDGHITRGAISFRVE